MRRRSTLGNYTLNLSYIGRGRAPIAPQPAAPAGRGQVAQAGPPQAQAGGRGVQGAQPGPAQANAILVASGPDEFFMCAGSGGLRIAFTPNTPGPRDGRARRRPGRQVRRRQVGRGPPVGRRRHGAGRDSEPAGEYRDASDGLSVRIVSVALPLGFPGRRFPRRPQAVAR